MEKYLYKQYSNTLTKVKDLAIKAYYYCNIEEYKDNPKKTWDVLRTLLPSKSISSAPNSVNADLRISSPLVYLLFIFIQHPPAGNFRNNKQSEFK